MFTRLVRSDKGEMTIVTRAKPSTQGLKKVVPGSPAGQKQIHEVENPIYRNVQK